MCLPPGSSTLIPDLLNKKTRQFPSVQRLSTHLICIFVPIKSNRKSAEYNGICLKYFKISCVMQMNGLRMDVARALLVLSLGVKSLFSVHGGTIVHNRTACSK